MRISSFAWSVLQKYLETGSGLSVPAGSCRRWHLRSVACTAMLSPPLLEELWAKTKMEKTYVTASCTAQAAQCQCWGKGRARFAPSHRPLNHRVAMYFRTGGEDDRIPLNLEKWNCMKHPIKCINIRQGALPENRPILSIAHPRR